MRKKIAVALAVVLAGILLSTSTLVAQATDLITGKDIKDNSVKGRDIDESTLGTVPKAAHLAPLKSGQTQSGAFSAAAPTNPGAGGWLAFDVTYPRALKTAISDDNIIDTEASPDATHCPGPGQAAPGYLCLYFQYHNSVGEAYGYSTDYPYSEVSPSVGVGFYIPVTGDAPYANGIWTVTAP